MRGVGLQQLQREAMALDVRAWVLPRVSPPWLSGADPEDAPRSGNGPYPDCVLGEKLFKLEDRGGASETWRKVS